MRCGLKYIYYTHLMRTYKVDWTSLVFLLDKLHCNGNVLWIFYRSSLYKTKAPFVIVFMYKVSPCFCWWKMNICALLLFCGFACTRQGSQVHYIHTRNNNDDNHKIHYNVIYIVLNTYNKNAEYYYDVNGYNTFNGFDYRHYLLLMDKHVYVLKTYKSTSVCVLKDDI